MSRKVGYLDESYGTDGKKGYTWEKASERKVQIEAELRKDPSIIEVRVKVLPLEGRDVQEGQYYVHNTSSYRKDL